MTQTLIFTWVPVFMIVSICENNMLGTRAKIKAEGWVRLLNGGRRRNHGRKVDIVGGKGWIYGDGIEGI